MSVGEQLEGRGEDGLDFDDGVKSDEEGFQDSECPPPLTLHL